ncbi:PASTA domain-containing protein [Nonomuraea jabiensis]|uniref:PASTA domain-containing protein n=1 Tax=Nonomuraea jabiensis TaxID=882448 RepID=A0A7W9LEX3_9ACTN|nr:PASTA domain-containing protein [Nonomuraea jabiensis]MBB5781270.1 hypothetical protein [Nonomuraea jabiensis]
MNRSEVPLLATFVVMGLAVTAALTTLVLGGPDEPAPPVVPLPATVAPSFSKADVVTMPELWFKEADDARAEIAALGFTAKVMRLNPEGIADPKEWVVAGQSPGPGTWLSSAVPILLHVVPEETVSRRPAP